MASVDINRIMEALQFNSITKSHWSSGSIVCFWLKGAAVRVPGMHPHLQWNQIILLAMPRYIGDQDVVDHWPRTRLRAKNGKLH
jgi:hypothetical protein